MSKKQGYSSVVCFLLVSIITIVLLLNGMIVHAEGVEENQSGSTLGSMFNFDYPALSFSGWQNSIFNTGNFNTNYLPQMSGSASNYPLNFDTSDFTISPKQFIFVNRSGWSLGLGGYLVLVDNDKVVAVTGNNCFGLATTDGSEFNIEIILYNNDGSISTAEDPIQDSSSGGIYTFTASRRIDIMTSSMFIYGSKNNYNISDAVTNIVLADDPTVNGFQMNYLLFDENGELEYENPFSGGSGGSLSEDIEKGLYLLKGSCVYLENKSFNDGTLHVNALFSDIQKNNPNLQVAVKGTCTYSFEQTPQSSLNTRIYVGEYSNTGDSSLFGILWPNESYTSTHTKTVNCRYGLLGADYIPIESFNGGKVSRTLSQVNSTMFTSDIGGYTMASFGGANIRPIASAYDTVNSNKFIIRNFTINTGTPISFNTGFLDESKQKTDVYLTDVKYNFELYVIDTTDENNIEWSDIIYSYSFDMLNGTSSVGTDGTLTYDDLNNNFDGDVPSEYLPSTDIDTSGGSSVSSSGGNNQVVTINGDDSAKYLPSLINKLLPSDSESDGGLSEDFQNIVNSNGWLTVIKYSFSFIPESFWDTMVTYFTALLGLVACAFLIRIILDLL